MKQIVLSIVIPCLNEESTIQRAVRDSKNNASKYLRKNYEIIVADNGSTDGTLDILKKERGIRVIHVPVRGYGAALHWGIMRAKGRYVIFADADMSYPFLNMSKFLDALKNDPDLVLGSRLKGRIEKGAMPFLHRYLGTPILTWLIRLIYGIPTSDCNSGMRMVKKDFYKTLNMRNSGMEWASELLLKTSIKKGRYSEVPITFLKDKRKGRPHLSTWSDGWRHLKSIILLKPKSLYIGLILFFLLAIIFYQTNFVLTFLFAELFIVLLLSLLTLNLIGFTIDHKMTKTSKFLIEFKLVPTTIMVSIAVGLFVILIPDSRLGSKLFFVSILGIIFMWIFFVETIKTHLVNRLPDNEKK